MHRIILAAVILLTCLTCHAQVNRPDIHYTITVDTNDLSSAHVEMKVKNLQRRFSIAMFTHPEYDDKFWRNVRDITVTNGTVTRRDSALWEINSATKNLTIRYKIQLPPPEQYRGAWKPFLSSTGGLIDGTHFLMYVEGHTSMPSRLTLQLPEGWKIATAMQASKDSSTLYAPNAFELMDAPLLVGHFRKWNYDVQGVTHNIVYWYRKDAAPFDGERFVTDFKAVSEQAVAVFGRLPYKEFTFLLQDRAWGALEHTNSVTVGADLIQLSENYTEVLNEVAHEYFHAWNLMRIRPAGFWNISYKKSPLSPDLWFSEGTTMFYADLLIRRAKMTVAEPDRVTHLKGLLGQYYGSPGYTHLSPELVSRASNGPQSLMGDYTASTHVQGELITVLLDLLIRDRTNGKSSFDNVMRGMMEKHSGSKGFTGRDVEAVVTAVSGYNVNGFFNKHIRNSTPLPFNDYLETIGLELRVGWDAAKDEKGVIEADTRIYAWNDPKTKQLLIGLIDPLSCWGKAGLHTGDTLLSVNGVAVSDQRTFFAMMRKLKIGDRVIFRMKKVKAEKDVEIIVTGYDKPEIGILPIKNPTEKQKRLLQDWLTGR
jgi:predicted metalloprotease with PDZ domain